MQQRCISVEAIELLLDFAPSRPCGDGAWSYRFDKHSWTQAAKALGPRAKHFEKYRHAYVIESAEGVVITACWLN
jgi:hypothetical protein